MSAVSSIKPETNILRDVFFENIFHVHSCNAANIVWDKLCNKTVQLNSSITDNNMNVFLHFPKSVSDYLNVISPVNISVWPSF